MTHCTHRSLQQRGASLIEIMVGVVIGLIATGWISAALGKAPRMRAIWRNVMMGSATMVATYIIGLIFGVAVG